jgi:hypothetical protein
MALTSGAAGGASGVEALELDRGVRRGPGVEVGGARRAVVVALPAGPPITFRGRSTPPPALNKALYPSAAVTREVVHGEALPRSWTHHVAPARVIAHHQYEVGPPIWLRRGDRGQQQHTHAAAGPAVARVRHDRSSIVDSRPRHLSAQPTTRSRGIQ